MSVNENVINNIKKYELVAPDGGWGYMIWVAAVINFSTTTMFLGCFGLIFNDLLVELDLGSTTVTFLGGINAISMALAGYFTSPLLKVMSLRQLAFLASFLFNLGVFGTIFVKSTLMLFICQGPLQMSGFGLLYNLSCTLINDYFVKRRLLAFSVTQAMSAMAAMVAPLFVKWSLDSYGFRGTLMLISGISFHTFLAAALMEPVDKHMRKIEILDGPITEEMKLLVDNKTGTEKLTTPTVTLTDTERAFEAKIGVANDKEDAGSKTFGLKFKISEVIDVSLLKKFLLSASSMGVTYSVFAEGIFTLMLPQALYSLGWKKGTVARALALNAFGDLFSRTSFIFLSKFLTRIGNHEIYLIGLATAVVSRLGMLWSENVVLTMVFLTIMGISRSSICVLPPLIFADSYSPEKFTSVMGIFMMVIGLMNLILGPALGAIRDTTESYPTVFYVVTSCFAVVILLWSIELCYKRNKHKRQAQREMAEKIRKANKNKGLKK